MESQRARMTLLLQAGRLDLARALHNWFFVVSTRGN